MRKVLSIALLLSVVVLTALIPAIAILAVVHYLVHPIATITLASMLICIIIFITLAVVSGALLELSDKFSRRK